MGGGGSAASRKSGRSEELLTGDGDQGQEQGGTPGESIAFGVLGTGYLLKGTQRSDSLWDEGSFEGGQDSNVLMTSLEVPTIIPLSPWGEEC